MKFKKTAAAIATAAVIAQSPVWAAPAKGDFYGAGSFNFLSADIANTTTLKHNALGIRVGQYLQPNLAVEGRFLLGIGKDSINNIDVSADSIFGGYLVGSLPVDSGFELQGLIGLASTTVTIDYSNSSYNNLGKYSDSDTSLSYGFGAAYSIDSKMKATAQYMKYYTGSIGTDDFDVSALEFGVEIAL